MAKLDFDVLKQVLTEAGVTVSDADATTIARKTAVRAEFRRLVRSVYDNLIETDRYVARNAADLPSPDATRTWLQARIAQIQTQFPTFPPYTPEQG